MRHEIQQWNQEDSIESNDVGNKIINNRYSNTRNVVYHEIEDDLQIADLHGKEKSQESAGRKNWMYVSLRKIEYIDAFSAFINFKNSLITLSNTCMSENFSM